MSLKAIRGFHDILPTQIQKWQFLEQGLKQVLDAFSFEEIRLPFLEKSAVFSRAVGETSDVVHKEMYSFLDRNEESLCLRPEGTASCMRALIEHQLIRHQGPQQLWYMGPMFRYERPQKGRQRQFYQLGVEAVGYSHFQMDAALLLMCQQMWQVLGLENAFTLQINTLGSSAVRSLYRKEIQSYFQDHKNLLNETEILRLEENPMRLLDSKSPDLQDIIAKAPAIDAYLDDASKAHFEGVLKILDDAKITYTLNPHLVRGLDYYNHTVFEWVSADLGAQGTVCAGGRYDGLMEQLGGNSTPAVGFAMGLERMILSMLANETNSQHHACDVYMVVKLDDGQLSSALNLAQAIRSGVPGCRVRYDASGASLKSQFKKADKSGAPFAIIVAQEELQQGQFILKPLRGQGEEQKMTQEALQQFLQQHIHHKGAVYAS